MFRKWCHAMLPRHIINSAPGFHASQLSHHPSVMQGNQRALGLLAQNSLPLPTYMYMYSQGFPPAFNYSGLLQHQNCFIAPSYNYQYFSVPYNTAFNDNRMSGSLNMERTLGRDPKRHRTPSGCHASSRSKVQKTHEMDSFKPASRESSKYDLRTSSKGFTQANWPKECEWRRGPRNYEGEQIQTNNVQIPKRPKHFSTSRGTSGHGGNKSHSQTNSWLTEEINAPLYACRTGSSSQSGLLSAPPPCLPLPPSHYFHSSAASSQASQSDSKSTYRNRLWFNLPQHRGPRKKESSKESVEFSILSYNVLAQCLLVSNKYLYGHCDEQILLWNHRRQKLLEEIHHADADVICLQEVESQHFSEIFKPALQSQGYAAIYKKRTGDKGDGCATFYKTSRFQKVSHSKLEYQRGIGLLDRDNVAIVVMLQPKGLSSSHQLCVANTHLLWNPRRGDIKLAQLGLLFAEIERLSSTNEASTQNIYHPVVLCGDFNSVPHCPLYKFVMKGHMTYQGMASVDVSGQVQGRARVLMDSPLWPKEIGVSSHCRYVDVTAQSSRSSAHTGGAPRRHRGKSKDNPVDTGHLPPDDNQWQLIHPFFFSSVYDHSFGNHEVTTNHSKTNCTVDYIFYSKPMPPNAGSPSKPLGRPNFTGHLSLVKRLTLFTDSEVRAMGGLPNGHWASDHLSLQAVLRLTPKD